MKKKQIIVVGIIFFFVSAIVFGFLYLNNPFMFEPTYYEAKSDCYEKVKIGMTYEEVDAVVGHLFADGSYGIDENGKGQVYLDHGLKLDGSCRIMFENFRVISNDLLFAYF